MEQRAGHSIVAECQLGSGSRSDLDVSRVGNDSASRTYAGCVEISAALGMSEEAAATGARGWPLIAPFGQGMENRPEAQSSIGQVGCRSTSSSRYGALGALLLDDSTRQAGAACAPLGGAAEGEFSAA